MPSRSAAVSRFSSAIKFSNAMRGTTCTQRLYPVTEVNESQDLGHKTITVGTNCMQNYYRERCVNFVTHERQITVAYMKNAR